MNNGRHGGFKRYSGGRMVTNRFIGKSQKPTEDELSAQLGVNKGVWDRPLAELAKEFDLVTAEWNSYSPKAGWSLRLEAGRAQRCVSVAGPQLLYGVLRAWRQGGARSTGKQTA